MKGQDDDDRISSLPDVILCHLLSFLPTKYSVRTRLLSTRWKYLFAHVPVLDFDSYNYNDNDISRRKFIDFVSGVLKMYNFPQIARFRFRSFAKQLDDLVTWILYAIRHNVQELDICVTLYEPTTIPQELFSSKMLSVLKLQGNFRLKPFPSCALLSSLKTLELNFLSFDLSARSILSICPVLEDLFLFRCDFGNEEVIDITNTSLRKLRIVECFGHSHELVLDVPSLVYFMYLNSDISGFRGENALTSLAEAVIYPDRDMCDTTFLQLLIVVSHARHLYLSMNSFEALYGYDEALPTFHKLTRLVVGKVSQAVYELLPHFLNSCSILEVLVFPEGTCDTVERISNIYMECYNNVPSCVLRHLKQVEFGVFTMLETEWKLVEYFLKNAQVLQKMKIRSRLNRKKQLELGKKLSTLSRFRLSKDCQNVIEFDDDTKDSTDETE